MFNYIILIFSKHLFFKILIFAVLMDTFLGALRAIKEHKFNSSVGIDGAIRKVAMLFSVVFLMIIDSIVQIDFLFMIPDEYLQYIGMERVGVCGLFCLMFILFECISILKNMTLCGLPVPHKLREFIQKFLNRMTDEMPNGGSVIVEEEHEAIPELTNGLKGE